MKTSFFLLLLIELSIFSAYSQQFEFEAEGDYALQNENYKLAIDYYTKALDIDKSNSYDYYLRGYAKGYIEDFSGAVADLSQAILMSPADKSAFWFSLTRYVKLSDGSYFKGFNYSSIEHKYFYAYYLRGSAKYNLSDFRGAVTDFDKYIVYDATSSSAFLIRGICKFELENYNGAISDFNSAISLDAENPTAYYYRGVSYYNVGSIEKGCLDLSKAGELGDAEVYDLIREYCN